MSLALFKCIKWQQLCNQPINSPKSVACVTVGKALVASGNHTMAMTLLLWAVELVQVVVVGLDRLDVVVDL
jgi:hypothetical protein